MQNLQNMTDVYFSYRDVSINYNTKTTQVLDNVGQRVVEYGIFNEFAERVQNSIPDNEISFVILGRF